MLAAPAVFAQSNPKATGSPQAPVIMEVYSDFQCPSCRKLYLETLKRAIAGPVQKGKVQLVHRDFPLPQHKYAREAARYAGAAARVGQYEKICDELFTHQDEWAANGNVDAVVARALSPADMATVRKLVKDPAIDVEINKDIGQGALLPIKETPTVLLKYNHRIYRIVGFVSYPILKKILDSYN